MTLDINTPEGQKYLSFERDAINLWDKHHPEMKYIETNKTMTADIDGFLIKGSSLIRAVEVKCRNMTRSEFIDKYRNKTIISSDKIRRSQFISLALKTPLMIWLYLIDDKLLLARTITDKHGRLTLKTEEQEMGCQKTCNGGTITRVNMFIDMSDAAILS